MKESWDWLRVHQKFLVTSLFAVAVSSFLLIYKLGSLTGHLAANETRLPTVRASLHLIWHNPSNLPLQVSRLCVALVLPHGGYTASRLPSVLIGFVTLGLFYCLVRRWYGWRIAAYGGLLLAVSPWFLHAARFANQNIDYMFMATLLLCMYALYHHQPLHRLYFLLACLSGLVSLYVPGMLWFSLIIVVFEHEHLRASLQALSMKIISLGSIVDLILLAPLIHALSATPSLYRLYIGLPNSFPTPRNYLRSVGRIPFNIALHGPFNPQTNLGHLPLINSFTVVMLIAGIYLYVSYWQTSRSRLLLSLTLAAVLLIGLGGPLTISVLLPIVFVVASGGIGYLLHVWLKVFPRNPLARSFGIGLIGVTLLFSTAYSLREYFTAWPDDPVTTAAFQQVD